eukprot:g6019.t1
MAEWYYVDDATNAQQGPCTVQQLGELFAASSVTDSTLFWKDGQADWSALSSLSSLRAQVMASRGGPPALPAKTLPPVPAKPSAYGGGGGGGGGGAFAQAQASGAVVQSMSDAALAALSQSTKWVEKRTADDVPYYFEPSSETVTWEKPDCLKSPEELQSNSGPWAWVSDEKEGWVPARILKESGDSANVQLQTGAKKSVKRSEREPLWPLNHSSLARIEDDLVMVDAINQGLMVHNLRERYRRDLIYTWVGANHSVLVSINPFKMLPIYSPATIEEYAKPSAYRLDPPHTFAIANSAFMKLTQENVSQAILISGESGAGKTEATKQCFNFLAEVAGSQNAVEQRILHANPVLESFGNAKTLRNNNSSRFGRWTEVHFDPKGQVCGARIENYLLEKQRVVSQAKGERNFHIFYQLCTSEIAQHLELGAPEYFRYLRESGCMSVPGIHDQKDFQEVEEAFNKLGFGFEEKCWCYETVAAVLHLGNISFSANGEGSQVDQAGAQALHSAARYLRVDPGALSQALTTRAINIRGEITLALNRPDMAYSAADALASAMYDSMFDWLVGRVNFAVQGEHSNKFIGVLDIFGFEIFVKNHFEQLCINYTNEKLQQHFNKHTFQEEETVYSNEQIRFEHIHFIDNQPVVDLIEKKPYGLMPLLDEEVKIPKGSDAGWLSKCKTHNAQHPCLKNAGSNPNRFVVVHYAGEVPYETGGFVTTNKDDLFRDLYDLVSGAQSDVTRSLFPPKDANPRRLTTLGFKFRKALLDLMELVDTCEPWYIRCIKPNDQKAANTFSSKMCIEQLTYAGVFEAVQIRKSGFPFRLPHRRFANRYRCLAYKETGWVSLGTRQGDYKGMCSALMRCVNQDFSKVQLGNTMVLYRAEEHRVLELLRNLCLERVLPVAQRMARIRIGRTFRRCMANARYICAQALNTCSGDAAGLDAAIARAEQATANVRAVFAWEPPEMRRCRDLRFALQERLELESLLQSLLHQDPTSCYAQLRAAVLRCNKIRNIPGTHQQMALENQARAHLMQAAAAKLDPIATEALAILEKKLMEDVSSDAAEVEYVSADIEEIRKVLSLPEEEFVRRQVEVAKELNDPERVINREIKLKELYLDANGQNFELSKLDILRSPEEWAALKSFTGKAKKAELASSFLEWTSDPIHKSLTDVSGLKGEAKKQFKNLLGYCGDRKYQYPDPLIRDIVAKGELEAVVFGTYNIEEDVVSVKPTRPPPSAKAAAAAAAAAASAASAGASNGGGYGAYSAPAAASGAAGGYGGYGPPAAAGYAGGGYGQPATNGSSAAAAGGMPAMPAMPAMAAPPLPPKPKPSEPQARVLYDYDPAGQEGMVAVSAGQIVGIKNRDSPDWWMAALDNGQEGWVPANYLEMQ